MRTLDSAGQSFAFSGHSAKRRAQTSAPEARMGLLPQAPEVAAHRREVHRAGGSEARSRLEAAAAQRDDDTGPWPTSEAAPA